MTEENQPQEPKDLRAAKDRAEARATEAENAATAAQSELREFKATTLFGNEKHAELFLKANPEAEITAESVEAFVKDYGLAVGEATPPPAETPPPEDPGAGLAGIGGAAQTSGSAPPAQPKMSTDEFEQLLVSNPQAAAEAYVKGTAPRNAENTQARELVKKGIIDH